jgi:hypothetical protein
MESLKLVKTLALLQMTLDTYGLPEDKYLAIFKEKAEFACKALLIVERVASDYNIKIDLNCSGICTRRLATQQTMHVASNKRRKILRHLRNVATHQLPTQQLAQYLLRSRSWRS